MKIEISVPDDVFEQAAKRLGGNEARTGLMGGSRGAQLGFFDDLYSSCTMTCSRIACSAP